jgi:hypothetical protein
MVSDLHAMITPARHTHPDLSIRQLCALFGVNRVVV